MFEEDKPPDPSDLKQIEILEKVTTNYKLLHVFNIGSCLIFCDKKSGTFDIRVNLKWL
jgi:hypothetical protein